MKTIKFIRIPALALMLAAGACSKTNSPVSTSDVTTADAAVMMSSSLASSSGGMASASADVAVNAQLTFNANPGCGGTKTYSFNRQSPQGSTTTYNYSFNYTYTLNCVNNVPDNVSSSATSQGSFDGPNLTTNDSGSSTLTVAGLAPGATAYTISGEYKRAGSFTSKTGNMATGNSAVDINLTNLTIPKNGGTITSGSATFTLTGTSKKGAFNFSGSITFIGNNQANLVINGTAYVVNLLTGTSTKS
jgi:hypothetical protein